MSAIFRCLPILAAVCALTLLLTPAYAQQTPGRWRITKAAWSDADERRFSELIQALGESGCRTVDKCIKSDANPYKRTDPPDLKWSADCADFPYLLRAYFAAKNGLPFSFISDVQFANRELERARDIRYTAYGNRVASREDIVLTRGHHGRLRLPSFLRTLSQLRGKISSAVFRINPETDDTQKLFSDVYPASISRETIRPGTTIYDPNGHVAIVYKIEDDGRILFMDAHPDNSVTRRAFSNRFARGRPAMAGGLKNWRPIRLVGATRDAATGFLVGGHIEGLSNRQLGERYSLVQYLGTEGNLTPEQYKQARWTVNGQQVNYYEYVRMRLALGELRYHPITELANLISDLCSEVQDRMIAVQNAIDVNIHDKAHPLKLPNNIYGTNEMEWETYSTPSRDARMKVAFKDLRDQVEHFMQMDAAHDPRLVYEGKNLGREMLETYLQGANSCVIQYKKSDGTHHALNLREIQNRLFDLSFDPYHCPERRWGASGAEAASCNDSGTDGAWYEAEFFLRNQLERTYDVSMDWTLSELQELNPDTDGIGVRNPPDVDTEGYLRSEGHGAVSRLQQTSAGNTFCTAD